MLYIVIVAMAIMLSVSAEAQVHVDIGINLPAPPQLVVIPEVRTVQYAPAAPANLFVYGGQYWAFANGGWYAGPSDRRGPAVCAATRPAGARQLLSCTARPLEATARPASPLGR